MSSSPVTSAVPQTAAFKRLVAIWNAEGLPTPQKVGFFLSEWVSHLAYVTRQVKEELQTNSEVTDKEGMLRYFRSVRRRLDELRLPMASLPTASPTNLLTAIEEGKEFAHSDYYEQVLQALASRGLGAATPSYDDEKGMLPFRNEYCQTNFLVIWRLMEQWQAEFDGTNDQLAPSSRALQKIPPPYIWEKELSVLADLLFTLREKGYFRAQRDITPTEQAKAVAALFQLPAGSAKKPVEDWERLVQYFATTERNGAKREFPKRSKKGYFKRIEPFLDE